MFPFIKLATVLQSVEDASQLQLASDSLNNMLLYLGLIIAAIVMMLIPVLLGFGMLSNYFKFQKLKGRIDHDMCMDQQHNHKHIKSTCNEYLKSYSSFTQYAFGLGAWNLFSLIYISTAFSDFSAGLLSYFNFPLEILTSIDKQDALNGFINFNSSWYTMLGITVLTLLFLQLGKNLGYRFGKSNLSKRTLNVSFS